MNNEKAKKVITKELENYRSKRYEELILMIDNEAIAYEIHDLDGVIYQIEITAFWDDKPTENVRVSGNIDDAGWRAFVPLNVDFIKSPNNDFISE